MTPYVSLQEDVIRTLRKFEERNPPFLRQLLADARSGRIGISEDNLKHLCTYGLHVPDQNWAYVELPKIIEEQLRDDGAKIIVRNILGSPLHDYGHHLGFREFFEGRGSGHNRLRTIRLSQPGALRVGDILATGDSVLSEPREGGNGAVLLHLTGGFDGHWISVPARIPIALLTKEDDVPDGYVEK